MNNQSRIIQNNEKRKCGLFTFHSAQNYGAFFQTYALVKALQKIGIQTEVIDYRPRYLESQTIGKFISINDIFPISLKKILTNIWNLVDILLNNKQKKKMNTSFQNAVVQYLPLSDRFYLSESDLKVFLPKEDKYMFYIAGSDQIWNSKATGGQLDPVYFLSCVEKHKRKIAYAASMGDIIQPKKEEMRFYSLVQNFDYISLREKTAIPYVQEFVNIPVESTLDPTLLLEMEEWKCFACEPTTHPPKFMVVYYNGFIKASFLSFAHKIAKLYQLAIVWISVKNSYFKYLRKYNYPCLEEFVWYFNHAEFILTDSFHGTMFSIINKKPFYTILSGWQKIRLVDHLERLGIADRFFESPKDIEKIGKNIDYTMVDNNLHVLQEISYQFLKSATGVE